ncbi:MAG: hypothetical protein KC546_03330 [Anaerolineae bacterium]|nr:hypothetical protein [Anaerolineae bacterium]
MFVKVIVTFGLFCLPLKEAGEHKAKLPNGSQISKKANGQQVRAPLVRFPLSHHSHRASAYGDNNYVVAIRTQAK